MLVYLYNTHLFYATNLFTGVYTVKGCRRRSGLIPIYKHSPGRGGTWE